MVELQKMFDWIAQNPYYVAIFTLIGGFIGWISKGVLYEWNKRADFKVDKIRERHGHKKRVARDVLKLVTEAASSDYKNEMPSNLVEMQLLVNVKGVNKEAFEVLVNFFTDWTLLKVSRRNNEMSDSNPEEIKYYRQLNKSKNKLIEWVNHVRMKE